MKQLVKLSLLLLAFMLPAIAIAHDFEVDGIYYNINGNEATVTYRGTSNVQYSNEYTGNVIIPASVTYNGTTYSVTAIGNYAFYECSGLTSVNIPNSITAIGSFAFGSCSALTNINIPNSVTAIGEYMFYLCTTLTSINIPNSVTAIGSYAFYGCTALTSINIPNSVTTIGGSAFKNTAWYNNQPDGVVYAGLVAYGHKGTMLNGTSISLRDGTLGIAQTAFEGCTGLTSIIIPNSVTNIGFRTFYNCTGLTSVNIPNSVTTIGGEAFHNCSGLTSVNIPNSVTAISNSTFSGCTALTGINIPNSVTAIGNYAFYECSGLTSINIPNSVTAIGKSAFAWCSSLAIISVASNNPNYDSRNNCNAIIETATNTIITGCKNTVIPNSVTIIGDNAFAGCTGLTSIDIPNSVTIIGDNAFAGCTGLTCIDIPNSVTSINELTFAGCSGLTSITIPNSVTSIGGYAFAGCTSLSEVIIPNSVTSIGEGAFDTCSSLTSITIPNSVTSIGFGAFFQCEGLTSVTFQHTDPVTITTDEPFGDCPNIKNVYISDISFWCMNDLSVIGFSNSYQDNHIFLNGVEITNLIIPNNVTRIASCAFTGCNSVTSLIIPNSVTTIGNGAFAECTGLKSISIPSSVTEIGNFAFYNCIGPNDVFCYILDPAALGPDDYDDYDDYWDWNGEYGNVSSRRTLHVPAGTIQNYQSDWRWNESYFGTIVEMDNHFEMPDTSVLYWETVTIPIVLSNDRNMLAFQTDIVLPEGFSIVTDEEDEYLIAPSNRLSSDHILMASDYGDGVVRVVCYTPESQPIDGYTGDLFYITVKVPENAAGDYPIILRNSRLTTEDYTELRIPDASAVINVKTYIPGDANNSRSVTVTDIVVTAQYVLGRNPQPFIFGAADMNGDGDVSVTDIMLIAYMLQHPSVNAPLRAPALTANNDRMSADAISLMPGETRTVNIMLDNDLDYSAFQLDLTLPEGLTASNFALTDRANGHTFDVCTIDDGRLRALCYSPTLATINGHKGALLTFDVTAMTHVTDDIIVDAIELVTNTSQTVDMGAFNIQVNNSSAVNEIVSGKTVARVEYYNVAGQQVAEPTSGLTIIVTTYTDGTRSTNKLHR